MPSIVERTRRWTELVLSDRRVVPALFVLYALTGVVLVLSDLTLNNEGVLTHYWASWASRELAPVFFFQKVKPVLALLYAPVAPFGLRATLVVHVLVSAAAIPLLASTARSLGHRLPNTAALVVAASPLFSLAGPAGLSNADGVVGIALVLYLVAARQRPFSAGLVAGMLPWVRFELVLFCAVLAAHALATKSERRLLYGMIVFPLIYTAAGALYHADVLWIAHYPPTVAWDPENPIYESQLIGLRWVLEPAAALTPVAALAIALRSGTLTRVERTLLAYAAVVIVVMNVLPIFKLGNFGSAPRYLLLLLPALALLIGRSLSSLWEGEPPPRVVLFATFCLGVWVATRQEALLAVLVLILEYAIVLELAHRKRALLAVGVAFVLVITGPLLPLRTSATRDDLAAYLEPMIAWLEAHPEVRDRPIYTNAQLLAPRLERTWPNADVTFLAGVDTAREIVELTNPSNGQRARVIELSRTDLYGKAHVERARPSDLPDDALLVLREDPRLPSLLPPDVWSTRLEILVEAPRFRVAELRTAVNPVALLHAAIEAHGGATALAQIDDLRVSSDVLFRDGMHLTRSLHFRAPSSLSMILSQEGSEVLSFGLLDDRCWRSENGVALPCGPESVADHRRIVGVLRARALRTIDATSASDAGTVDLDGVAAPAIRIGDMRLAFHPESHLLVHIDYEEAGVLWVERYSDFVERSGAKIAAHRELTIGGEPDVSETWTEIVPGGADPARLIPPSDAP